MPWSNDSKGGPWGGPGRNSSGGGDSAGAQGDEAGDGRAEGERRRGPWDARPSGEPCGRRGPWGGPAGDAAGTDTPDAKPRGASGLRARLPKAILPKPTSSKPTLPKPTSPKAAAPRSTTRKPSSDAGSAAPKTPRIRPPRLRTPKSGEDGGVQAGGPWGRAPSDAPTDDGGASKTGGSTSGASTKGQSGRSKPGQRADGSTTRRPPGSRSSTRPAREAQARDPRTRPGQPLQTPGPDLDELRRQLRAGLAHTFGGRRGRWLLVRLSAVLVGGLVCGWAASGVYLVRPDEQAVVIRFGVFERRSPPGLNYHLPWPIESVRTVSTTQVHSLDVGGGPDETPQDSYMPTRDGDIADVDFLVDWRVANAGDYLFHIADPQATIRLAAEAAVAEAVGHSTFSAVTGDGRAAIQAEAAALIQRRLDAYGAGVIIAGVRIRSADPPQETDNAAHDLAAARQDAATATADAGAYRDRVLAEAKGDAAKALQAAQGYSDETVKEAEGEASRFDQVDAEYRKAPELTRTRLYLETVQQVLAGSKKVIVDIPKGANAPVILPTELFQRGAPGVPAAAPAQADAAK